MADRTGLPSGSEDWDDDDILFYKRLQKGLNPLDKSQDEIIPQNNDSNSLDGKVGSQSTLRPSVIRKHMVTPQRIEEVNGKSSFTTPPPTTIGSSSSSSKVSSADVTLPKIVRTKYQADSLLGVMGSSYQHCSWCNEVKIISPEFPWCMRCKACHYCNEECQRADWTAGNHKNTCVSVTGRERDSYLPKYTFIHSKPTHRVFTLDECLQAGPQPLDPTPAMLERHQSLGRLWFPQEFVYKGETVFSAPFLPPEIVQLIREGLRNNTLTWMYLMSDNFFLLAGNASLPVSYLSVAVKMMTMVDPKPNAAYLLECNIASTWESRTSPGRPQFNLNWVEMLKRKGLSIKYLGLEGTCCDALRQLTHRRGTEFNPCGCYHCLKQPYVLAKKRELWESHRLAMLKRGVRLMSFKQYEEINAGTVPQGIWDICNNVNVAMEEEESQPPTKRGRKKKLPKGEPRVSAGAAVLLDTSYPPDDDIPIGEVSPEGLQRIVDILTYAKAERRWPTHGELDEIMAIFAEANEQTSAIDTTNDISRLGTVGSSLLLSATLHGRSVHSEVSRLKSSSSPIEDEDEDDSGSDSNLGATQFERKPPKRAAAVIKKAVYVEDSSEDGDSETQEARTSSSTKRHRQCGESDWSDEDSASTTDSFDADSSTSDSDDSDEGGDAAGGSGRRIGRSKSTISKKKYTRAAPLKSSSSDGIISHRYSLDEVSTF